MKTILKFGLFLIFITFFCQVVAASEVTETIVEKTVSLKANFTCPPYCEFNYPVEFKLSNADNVKYIKVTYNVHKPIFLLQLVLVKTEACSGQYCYNRYTSGLLVNEKSGSGSEKTNPYSEEGFTDYTYKIRSELHKPIGSTDEDSDVDIKVEVIRIIPDEITKATTAVTTTQTTTPITITTSAVTTTQTTIPITTTTSAITTPQTTIPITTTTSAVTTTQTTIPITTAVTAKPPITVTTSKSHTFQPTDIPTQSSPSGAEIGIIAVIGAALFLMNRK